MRAWLVVALVALAACGAAPVPSEETPGALDLPAADDHLPDTVGGVTAADWADGSRQLPAGLDPNARYADEILAYREVTIPFGDRPMPPGGPGITGEGLESDQGEMRLTVNVPVFGDPRQWGEQYLLVLRQDALGWRLDQAYVRRLCTADAAGEMCVGVGTVEPVPVPVPMPSESPSG